MELPRAIRLIHQRSQTVPFTCTEDGKSWPCPTVEALREAREPKGQGYTSGHPWQYDTT